MHTFLKDTNDDIKIYSIMNKLIDEIYSETINEDEKLYFKTIVVRVRYEDFETHTKQKSYKNPVKNIVEVKKTAKKILDEFLVGRKIRLIGVSFTNFTESDNVQKELF